MRYFVGENCIVKNDKYPDAIGTVVYDHLFNHIKLYLICYGSEDRKDRFAGSVVAAYDPWYEVVNPNFYYTWKREDCLRMGRIILSLDKLVEQLENEIC